MKAPRRTPLILNCMDPLHDDLLKEPGQPERNGVVHTGRSPADQHFAELGREAQEIRFLQFIRIIRVSKPC